MKHRLLVAGAACLWGMWSLSFRGAESSSSVKLSGATETLVVYAFMAVLMAPFAWRTRGENRNARAWALLVLLGVVDGLNGLCFFTALQHTTVALAVLTHYLAPLLVAVTAPLFTGDRWRARTFLALGVALAGLVLLLQPWSIASGATGADALVGPALGALSAVFFASSVIIAKVLGDLAVRDGARARFSIYEMGAIPKLPGCAVLAVAAVAQGGPGALVITEAGPLGALFVGALLFGTVPLVMFYRGLAHTPVSQASVLTLCEPLVAVLVGAVVFHELPGPLAIVGGALVVGGAAAIALAPRVDVG